MDNKEIILESSKREMAGLVRCKYPFTDIFELKIKWITEDCNKLNIKDKELDDLIEFRRILRNGDIIEPDIKLPSYKLLVEALPIYKEKGIKAVNEYLRSVSINRESTNNTEQKIVITNNQEQTTNTNSNNIGLNKNLNTIFSKINSNTPLDEKDHEFLKKLELSEIPDAEIFEQVSKSVLADTKDFLELTDSEIINFVNNDTIAYNIVVTMLKLLGSKSFIGTLLTKDELLNGIDKNRLNDKDYLLELFDNLPMNMQDAVYKIIVRISNMETFGTDDNIRNTINIARQLKTALTPKEQESVIDTKEQETDNTKEQETTKVETETNNTIIEEPESNTNTKTEDVKQETSTKQHKAEKQQFTNVIIDCIKGRENFPFVETGYFSADGIEYKNLITKKVVTYTKEEFANFKIQYLNDPLIQFRNAINDNLKSLNPCDYLMMKGYQITLNNPRTFIIDGYLWCVNIRNNSSFCLYKDMMTIILNNGAIYIIYFDKCSIDDLYNLVEQYWNTGTIEPRLFAKLIKSKALVLNNTTTK